MYQGTPFYMYLLSILVVLIILYSVLKKKMGIKCIMVTNLCSFTPTFIGIAFVFGYFLVRSK